MKSLDEILEKQFPLCHTFREVTDDGVIFYDGKANFAFFLSPSEELLLTEYLDSLFSIKRPLSAEEVKIISTFDFYKSWTLKEALGKADGRGLSYNIKDIPVSTGKVLYEESVYYNYCTQYDNYIISVSVKNIEAEGLDIIIENIKESQ
jgi:hypothetical protein